MVNLRYVAKYMSFIILKMLDQLRILSKRMAGIEMCFKKGNLTSLYRMD